MIDLEPEAILVAVTFFCYLFEMGVGRLGGRVHTRSLSIVDRG